MYESVIYRSANVKAAGAWKSLQKRLRPRGNPRSAYEKRMTMRSFSSPDPFLEEYFPSWNLRVNIGVEIATALNFLHTINKPKSLIHGDVKRYITMPPHMQSPPAATLLPLITPPPPSFSPCPFITPSSPFLLPLSPSSLPPPLSSSLHHWLLLLPSPLVPFITASSPSFSPSSLPPPPSFLSQVLVHVHAVVSGLLSYPRILATAMAGPF